MPRHIVDTGVLVELAIADAFALLDGLIDLPCLVPDEVDAELEKGRGRHPVHFARYQAALQAGRLVVVSLVVGTPAHAEFLRLRATRTSPQRNRGEDACLALALTSTDDLVYLIDQRARNRALAMLPPARVRGLADLPGWPPGP